MLTHLCVQVSIFFTLNTLSIIFLLEKNNTSFPFSPILFPFPLFRPILLISPLSSPTTWHCNAGFRNGNEVPGGIVSKSSRLNISLNGPANVCMFFKNSNYPRILAQEPRVRGGGGTLQWTPALLTPHDAFMCLGVIAWIITSTGQNLVYVLHVAQESLCWRCLLGVCFPQSKVFHI